VVERLLQSFTVKFFRRVGNTLTVIAERGPFSTDSTLPTFTLSAPVEVNEGDLIGVTQAGNCGLYAGRGIPSMTYLSFATDVTGSVDVAAGTTSIGELSLYGAGNGTDALAAVFPVAGSVTGVGGSSFKTSLQMLNTSDASEEGVIVFRRAGVPASAADPGLPFVIGPGQVFSFPDVASATGLSGLGSLDVITPIHKQLPQMLVRVYNDAGSSGTAGFFEEAAFPAYSSAVIPAPWTARMITPVDPSRTRFNIGVRTLFAGATFTAQLLDQGGHVVTSVTKTYPAGWFEQVDSTSFFGGVPVVANGSVVVTVSQGCAIVYGATTDNVTQDPSMQYAVLPPNGPVP
jgi:hypothetical protein